MSLAQWLLAIPQLFIAYALSMVRAALTLISFFTVVCTRRISRPLFDAAHRRGRRRRPAHPRHLHPPRADVAVAAAGQVAARRPALRGARYNVRVQAYAGLLTDQYPPFSLQAG